MRENVNRLGTIGHGGVKCSCCAPGGTRARRKLIRPARRKAQALAIREGRAAWLAQAAEQAEAAAEAQAQAAEQARREAEKQAQIDACWVEHLHAGWQALHSYYHRRYRLESWPEGAREEVLAAKAAAEADPRG
jgi:hypothetical protein